MQKTGRSWRSDTNSPELYAKTAKHAFGIVQNCKKNGRKRGCDTNPLELVHRGFDGAFSLEDRFFVLGE